MSRDLQNLYILIGKQFKVIEASIEYIKSTVDDGRELISEVYFIKKDTFELSILMRALRDMLLDELEQARYERNNGDME